MVIMKITNGIKSPGTAIAQWFVYIVECSDGTLYTGYTNDVFKRVICHNICVSGAKYTRSRRPVKLVHYESYPTKKDAMKQEASIKALSREEKIKYINGCGSQQV
jgi:putative endonuclease